MPSVIKKQRSDISPTQAHEIVINFEAYPEFLPWCHSARTQSFIVHDNGTQEFIADLVIKYKLFKEVFTTRVISNPEMHTVDIDYLQGPFKHLKSYWRFNSVLDNPNQVDIEFMIDFSVKFGAIQSVLTLFFEEAMKKMVTAFDARFKSLARHNQLGHDAGK